MCLPAKEAIMRRSVYVAATVLSAAAVTAVAFAATSTRTGGPITAVKVVRGTGIMETSSRTYVDLPGAATTITIPEGERGLILARFTASSQCGSFNPDDDGCFIRILVGGVDASPSGSFVNTEGGPFDTAFCCPNNSNADSFESHAIERSRGPLPPGAYRVKVQWLATAESTFTLWGWHLAVERARIPD
jgi:hypothetical protein